MHMFSRELMNKEYSRTDELMGTKERPFLNWKTYAVQSLLNLLFIQRSKDVDS